MDRRPDHVPDHTAELTKLRARLYSPELSALEAAGMLAALELLRGHEQGTFEICDNPSCISFVSRCLGERFEAVHDEELDECSCCCCCH